MCGHKHIHKRNNLILLFYELYWYRSILYICSTLFLISHPCWHKAIFHPLLLLYSILFINPWTSLILLWLILELFPIFCCYECYHVGINILSLPSQCVDTSFFVSKLRNGMLVDHSHLRSYLERSTYFPKYLYQLISLPPAVYKHLYSFTFLPKTVILRPESCCWYQGYEMEFCCFFWNTPDIPDICMYGLLPHLLEVFACVTLSARLSLTTQFKIAASSPNHPSTCFTLLDLLLDFTHMVKP